MFLIDKLNKKQEGITELNIALKLNPHIDEIFMIMRCLRMNDELGDNYSVDKGSSGNSIDYASKIAYEQNFKQLR
jgi:hypothetical protein